MATTRPAICCRVTNALGQAVAMTYDTLGRKIGMNDPDMGAWGYAYDAAGRLIAQTDAKGQTIALCLRCLGRVLSKSILHRRIRRSRYVV